MRINSFFYDNILNQTNLVNARIVCYNPDLIVIPNTNNYTFKIKAAIMYIGDSRAGHYVIWKKLDNGWLRISDSNSIFYQNLIQNLKNIYLLFLERN